MSFNYARIGERIRFYRTKAGMSQSDLAAALFISSNHYISRLENGKVVPSLELIITMAEVFHIRTDDLLTDSTPMEKPDDFFCCPSELEPIMARIMEAISTILTEDYKK